MEEIMSIISRSLAAGTITGTIFYAYSKAVELKKLPENLPFFTPAGAGAVIIGGIGSGVFALSTKLPRTSLALGIFATAALFQHATNNHIKYMESTPLLEKSVSLAQ